MKPIFYLVLVTGTAFLFSISSCKKEPLPPVRVNTGNYPNWSGDTTYLRVNRWVRDANEFYVHTFQDIISIGATVKVFVLKNGNDVQINQYIFFMGGQLWASAHNSDLQIFFRSSGPPPSMDIKMVIR